MNSIPGLSEKLMQLIAEDQLDEAIQELQSLLKGSPAYLEVIVQSARYNDIMKEIRMGTLSFAERNSEKNKIRYALFDMIRELEEQSEARPDLKQEIEQLLEQKQINITSHSTNTGSKNITAQGISGSSVQINVNPFSEDDTE